MPSNPPFFDTVIVCDPVLEIELVEILDKLRPKHVILAAPGPVFSRLQPKCESLTFRISAPQVRPETDLRIEDESKTSTAVSISPPVVGGPIRQKREVSKFMMTSPVSCRTRKFKFEAK